MSDTSTIESADDRGGFYVTVLLEISLQWLNNFCFRRSVLQRIF